MRRALLVLAALVLAGCGGPEAEPTPLDVDWVDLDVETTATEPLEYRGFIRIGWSEDAFGIDSESEHDLHRFTQRVGDAYYTSDRQMGWTEHAVDDLSPRIVLWDLRRLAAEADTLRSADEDGLTVHTARGTAAGAEYELVVRAEGRQIVSASLDAPAARESPFNLTPAAEPLGFPLGVPEDVLSGGEASAGTAESRDHHAFLIGLIQSHKDKPGRGLPDEVTPESLRLELVQSGEDWPENAFDGSPLRDVEESGHFLWTKCGEEDGSYVGFGWDGAVLSKNWGTGCRG